MAAIGDVRLPTGWTPDLRVHWPPGTSGWRRTRSGPSSQRLQQQFWESDVAKGEQKSNREIKKPKKKKVVAAVPGQKPSGWQPAAASGKKS
jgi:hypothetical protein